MPAAHLGVVGEGFAGAGAIGREPPDFLVSTNIADCINPFSIDTRNGGADARILGHGDVDATARIGRRQRCRATRDQQRARTIGGQRDIIEIVQWLLQPAHAALLEIADQVDRHDPIRARGQVDVADVRAVLIDDVSILQLRITNLELVERGQRTTIAAIGGHAPEIVAAALVAEVIEATLPPHWPPQRGVHLKRQPGCLAGTIERCAPDLRHGSALVAARMVAGDMQAKAGEEDRDACGIETGLVGIGKRQGAQGQCLRIDRAQDHAAARPGHRRTCIEHLVVRRPAQHMHAGTVETQALRRAAGQRHDIDLGTGIVARDKGDLPAIRGNRRLDLLAGMAGQALRGAAGCRHAPQVALGSEDQRVPVQRGAARIDRFGLDRIWTEQQQQRNKTGFHRRILPGPARIVPAWPGPVVAEWSRC